jgi:hypothetical protein
MCSYLGRFAKQALATFLLFASHIVNHGEPFSLLLYIVGQGGGRIAFLLLTAVFALYYTPAFSRLPFHFQLKVALLAC